MIKQILITGVLLLSSCNIIEIREFKMDIKPSGYNQILHTNETINISFSEDVAQSETESIISIQTFFGEEKVELDFFWPEKDKLIIIPIVPLNKGVRYLLSIEGTIETSNGNTYTRNDKSLFYFESKESYCELVSYYPTKNANIGIYEPLVFTFSHGLNQMDFEDNFNLSPNTEASFSWNGTNTEVIVSPKEKWEQYAVYTWEIDQDITLNSAQRLLEKRSASFLVQSDIIPPQLLSISGGTYENEIFTETSIDTNGVEYNSTLKFSFSERIFYNSFESSLSVTPDIEGEIISLNGIVWYFIPSENWEQNTEYNLILTTEIKDISGNATTQKTNVYFTPIIETVTIQRVTINSTHTSNPPPVVVPNSELSSTIEYDVKPSIADGSISVVIELDEGSFVSNESKSRFINSISLDGLFPKVTGAQIAQINWITDNKVQIFFVSIMLPVSDTYWNKQSYQLRIKGGQQYNTDFGAYLEEDINVNLNIIN